MSLPNGFDGAWNPLCPHCGGYMHTGHTDDCPVTAGRNRELAKLAALLRQHNGTPEALAPTPSESGPVAGGGTAKEPG